MSFSIWRKLEQNFSVLFFLPANCFIYSQYLISSCSLISKIGATKKSIPILYHNGFCQNWISKRLISKHNILVSQDTHIDKFSKIVHAFNERNALFLAHFQDGAITEKLCSLLLVKEKCMIMGIVGSCVINGAKWNKSRCRWLFLRQ